MAARGRRYTSKRGSGVAPQRRDRDLLRLLPHEELPEYRPAYRVLKELGFERLGVLDLPTNFHTDCVAKGYPVET